MKKVLMVCITLLFILSMSFGALAGVEKGVYDRSLLINWTDQTFQETYGVNVSAFKPTNPQPLTYIVSCEPVIDPRTGKESQTSWSYYHRTNTASTEDVLKAASDLSAFSLTLTDDPNKATYRAVISFVYASNGYFNYSTENASIPKYKGILTVTLNNMVTGESAKASRDCWAFPESSIEKSVLDEGIGHSFFAGPVALDSSEISAFNDMLGLGIDALYDYCDDEDGGVCITDYLGENVKKLELPSIIHGKPVTGIGMKALAFEYFSEIILPDTLTHIDESAFESCNYLTSIRFPASLTSIGVNAFNNSALQEVNVPDSVQSLGNGAFSACADLKSARLPAGLTKIPDSLLWGTSISSIEIPVSVTEIGKSAFGSCDNLKSVFLPASVRIIGERAFDGCDALTEVTCAGEIELVGHGAFGKCEKLVSLRFQDGVKVIDEYALNYCKSLKSIDLFGLESLGSSAFRWDTALTSVSLPETLTEIGKDPFGEHRKDGASYAIPASLKLTVIKGSYAEAWAVEEKIPYISVEPPTEEEIMARRYPVLQKGSKGEAVRLLQQTLIDMGYLNDIADGSYGPKTAAAVSAAQEAFGMEADGIASALFQAKLFGDM